MLQLGLCQESPGKPACVVTPPMRVLDLLGNLAIRASQKSAIFCAQSRLNEALLASSPGWRSCSGEVHCLEGSACRHPEYWWKQAPQPTQGLGQQRQGLGRGNGFSVQRQEKQPREFPLWLNGYEPDWYPGGCGFSPWPRSVG